MKALSRSWQYVEALIGLLLIFVQSVFLYYFYQDFVEQLEILPLLEVLAGETISSTTIFLKVHLSFLVPIVGIIGGILLFSKSQIGWYIAGFASITGLLLFTDLAYIAFLKELDIISMWLFLCFLFSALIMVLFSKPFIERYTPTLKGIVWVIALVLLAILDFWLVYFFT